MDEQEEWEIYNAMLKGKEFAFVIPTQNYWRQRVELKFTIIIFWSR